MIASDLIDKEENTPIESCILWVLDDAYAEGYGSRIVNNQAHFLADKAAADLAALTAERDALREALQEFDKLLAEKSIDHYAWDKGWTAALKHVKKIFEPVRAALLKGK